MRTLCLHPPSYEGFDGGAGSRYQAKREIRSFWYPTWLAQVAAIVPGSTLVDAPAAGLGLDDVLPLAGQYDLAVLHTSSPSFAGDVGVAEALKRANPALKLGLVGAKVAVEPEASLLASDATSPSPRSPRAGRWPRSRASRSGTWPARWCTPRTGRSWSRWTACRTSPTCTSVTWT
jgi:hypothetical protein